MARCLPRRTLIWQKCPAKGTLGKRCVEYFDSASERTSACSTRGLDGVWHWLKSAGKSALPFVRPTPTLHFQSRCEVRRTLSQSGVRLTVTATACTEAFCCDSSVLSLRTAVPDNTSRDALPDRGSDVVNYFDSYAAVPLLGINVTQLLERPNLWIPPRAHDFWMAVEAAFATFLDQCAETGRRRSS